MSLCKDLGLFTDLRTREHPIHVRAAYGEAREVTKIGTITICLRATDGSDATLSIPDVIYDPAAQENLLSWTSIVEHGISISTHPRSEDRPGYAELKLSPTIRVHVAVQNGLYRLKPLDSPKPTSVEPEPDATACLL
eukprot:scaffold7213_cov437-Prasinococcus_capsulatus_cf.AAC.1